MLNPFETDAYSLVSLTQSINLLPNNYGRVRELGLMPDKGITTRTVIVEEQNGVLNLLPTLPVGAPGTQNKMGKRNVRSLMVPHIPMDDVILPSEYEGVRAFGTENQAMTVAQVMNNHLQTAKNKFAITLEHLRMGALKGIILDADGAVLYNLYTEFGIAAKSIDFVLGTNTTDVRNKCMDLVRHIEDNLQGEVMSGVRCLVSAEFFDKLVAHTTVKDVFKNTSNAKAMLGEDVRKGFSFGGVLFEEYRGTATDKEGVSRRFIASGDGHAFPEGTMETFQTVYSPADFIETANTIGLPLYAKQEARKFNRGIDLHIQSNPLPICYRPSLLVRVFSSN
jgi:hypothetical protein